MSLSGVIGEIPTERLYTARPTFLSAQEEVDRNGETTKSDKLNGTTDASSVRRSAWELAEVLSGEL